MAQGYGLEYFQNPSEIFRLIPSPHGNAIGIRHLPGNGGVCSGHLGSVVPV